MSPSGWTQLVERARNGDAAAWSDIVSGLENLVWSVVRGFRLSEEDAKDVAQLTWLRAVEKLDRIHDPERIGLWLATIARRECMRVIERGSRSLAVDPQEGFVDLTSAADSEAEVERRAAAKAILAALSELSDDCQQLLRLVLCDPPVAYADISELLGIAVGTIGARRSRCLSRLRAASGY